MRAWGGRRVVGGLLTALVVSCAGLVAAPSAAQAGVPPEASTAVLHGQRLTLDGGALRVRPTAARPTVPLRRARFDLMHSTAGGIDFEPGRAVYGAATVTARRTVDPDEPGRYPTFRSTPAWVLFFDPGGSTCLAGLAAPQRVAPQRVAVSASSVMVIDARTGAALIYRRAGFGTCAAARKPSVTKVAERLSVPWTTAALPPGTPVTTVIAHSPGCSAGFSAGGSSEPGGPSLLGVQVDRAFGPCDHPGGSVAVPVSALHFVAPLRHAPVGPIPTGQRAF